VLTERDAPVGLAVGEEYPPPILLEREMAEMRPAIAICADGGAEVHVACDQVRPEVRTTA